jgi:hypothetical protein
MLTRIKNYFIFIPVTATNHNTTKTTMKTIYTSFITDQVTFDNVIELDLSGLTNYDGSKNTFYGTVSIKDQYGWHDYTGEHGATDFSEQWGFELAIIEL